MWSGKYGGVYCERWRGDPRIISWRAWTNKYQPSGCSGCIKEHLGSCGLIAMINTCSQGDHVLVGTDRDMRLWGVEDRKNPRLLSTVRFCQRSPHWEENGSNLWFQVPAEHVCCCVLFYPQAACTGLILRPGLQVRYCYKDPGSLYLLHRSGTWSEGCHWGICTPTIQCGWWQWRETS